MPLSTHRPVCSLISSRAHTDLAALPLLRDAPEALITHLARHTTPVDGKQRKLLFLRGDPENFIGLVLRGGVYHSLQEPDGHEVIMDRTQPGEMVGESALLQSGRRSSNALLGSNSQLLLLHQQHFAPLQDCAQLMNRVQQQLCARLQRISSFVETVCLYRLEARLARHLLAEMEQSGRPGPDGVTLPMPANQGTLAAMLNASRPRLNAQLKQWQRDGLIQLSRQTLRILDPDKLSRIARQLQP
ncbi:Crp/Fnr family transcriptional regulator [Chromobacterium subtsugae]|uniref:Crp/Fnr family transcriptional regulator n=1 Tax=Chromobacterium subtsugae TaxID=251747 RepID=UPI0006417125|nr:Crp/Fnr family transcriptional regulator [Chromobacterium subtsugae]